MMLVLINTVLNVYWGYELTEKDFFVNAAN